VNDITTGDRNSIIPLGIETRRIEKITVTEVFVHEILFAP